MAGAQGGRRLAAWDASLSFVQHIASLLHVRRLDEQEHTSQLYSQPPSRLGELSRRLGCTPPLSSQPSSRPLCWDRMVSLPFSSTVRSSHSDCQSRSSRTGPTANRVILGTEKGALLVFDLSAASTSSGEEPNNCSKCLSADPVVAAPPAATLVSRHDGFSKKPIDQLGVIKELNALVCLSGESHYYCVGTPRSSEAQAPT